MRTPELDKRTYRDIVRYIKNISTAYTPEWRFDDENPDVGTALALLYADMFSDTIKRFNMVADKNLCAFFNAIDARLYPAIPAKGYVCFGLAGDTREGVPVKAATQLYADSEDDETERVTFETVNDVYVTPAEIEHIFSVSGERDTIVHAYDKNSFRASPEAFHLFSFAKGNLQEHRLYFCHNDVLNIKGSAWIELDICPAHGDVLPEEFLSVFAEEGNAVWEYWSESGYSRFDSIKIENDRLLLFKSEREPAFAHFEQEGVESFWIRCSMADIKKCQSVSISSMKLASSSTGISPDLINAAGIDQGEYGCFPFGEKFSVYDCVYFACDEVLCKKGAEIKLSFTMEFERIPIDIEIPDPNVNWKLIMKRSQFKEDKEYDITIEEVIWEYYNGQGWARIFSDRNYADTFGVVNGTLSQVKTISFTCPEDITKVLINSYDGYFIRARIIRVNNAYKIKGDYLSPRIEGVSFSYEYKNGPVHPQCIYSLNNLKKYPFTIKEQKDAIACFSPFISVGNSNPALYLGFEIEPVNGPIKILFSMDGVLESKPPRLIWEYFSERGWKPLNIIDETDSFYRTGITTLMCNNDFERCEIYGRELYWIRLMDQSGSYNDTLNPTQLPCVRAIYMNATHVINLETQTEELFYVEPQQKDLTCKLIHKKVSEIEVWVNEQGIISQDELRELRRRNLAKIIYDHGGAIIEAWVKWEQVEDFILSEANDRHYAVDKNEGIVLFADGQHGRIPPSRADESLKIKYKTGGGEIGNVEAGRIDKLSQSIGFVNSVVNPAMTSGGADQETLSEALARNAAALRHGYRAVTTTDYENLALEATRNILKAKCFSNFNQYGKRQPGSVTLAVLQKDFINGRDYFENIKEQVTDYIKKRICGNVAVMSRFEVVEPQFLELCVKVEIQVSDFSEVFNTKETILERLEGFINPMTGNFDGGGWEIGTIPNRTQLFNCLKDIPTIKFIKNVFITAFTQNCFGRVEVDLDNLEEYIFTLPLNGNHEIIITAE